MLEWKVSKSKQSRRTKENVTPHIIYLRQIPPGHCKQSIFKRQNLTLILGTT